MITSRNRLPGLLLAHGARPLIVEMPSDADARELLVTRLGTARMDTEPQAAAELLGYCGGFPLALGIVAGRAQTYPAFALADLAAELREATTRIGVLDDEDPTASLPAILSWSYTAPARRPGAGAELPRGLTHTGYRSSRNAVQLGM